MRRAVKSGLLCITSEREVGTEHEISGLLLSASGLVLCWNLSLCSYGNLFEISKIRLPMIASLSWGCRFKAMTRTLSRTMLEKQVSTHVIESGLAPNTMVRCGWIMGR